MNAAVEARLEFERMMAIGDAAIMSGQAADLLEGAQGATVVSVARDYERAVIELERTARLRWDGEKHVPLG